MATEAGARKREIAVSEIRDFFCCPYMWWFRNEPLGLFDREKLERLKQEPGWGRPRTMSYEVEKTPFFWLFAIALAVASGIAWLVLQVVNGPRVGAIAFTIRGVGFVFLALGIYLNVRWLLWRRRTPFYSGQDRPLPGEVLFWKENEPGIPPVHASEYGIWGDLNIVVRQGRKIITMEYRSVETPRRLTGQDRMEAVARALLAEAEFGKRPRSAYVVYPDRTFEVPIEPEEVRHLLDAVFTMHRAEETAHLPELERALHICPTCPVMACKAMAAAGEDKARSASD